MKSLKTLAVISMLTSALAFAQKAPPAPPAAPAPPAIPGPGMMGPGMMGMGMMGPPGIPPAVAQKIGIPADTVKKVRDLAFDANDALINLEADLKRAQLDLEKAMSQTNIDESAVMLKLENIAKAELAVRKNRVGLMLKIRKTVGADAWEKLQAEMPPFGGGMGGPGMRREVRIIKHGDGREDVDVRSE